MREMKDGSSKEGICAANKTLAFHDPFMGEDFFTSGISNP